MRAKRPEQRFATPGAVADILEPFASWAGWEDVAPTTGDAPSGAGAGSSLLDSPPAGGERGWTLVTDPTRAGAELPPAGAPAGPAPTAAPPSAFSIVPPDPSRSTAPAAPSLVTDRAAVPEKGWTLLAEPEPPPVAVSIATLVEEPGVTPETAAPAPQTGGGVPAPAPIPPAGLAPSGGRRAGLLAIFIAVGVLLVAATAGTIWWLAAASEREQPEQVEVAVLPRKAPPMPLPLPKKDEEAAPKKSEEIPEGKSAPQTKEIQAPEQVPELPPKTKTPPDSPPPLSKDKTEPVTPKEDQPKEAVSGGDPPQGGVAKQVDIDGGKIADKAAVAKQQAQDHIQQLRAAFGDYPLPFVTFTPTGSLRPGTRGGLDATVRYAIDAEAYRKYLARLEPALRKVAVRSGDVTFRLRWKDDKLCYWEPGFSRQDVQVLEAALRDGGQTDCRLLFVAKGKLRSFVDAPVAIDRYHLLDATWYLLRDGPSAVPPQVWERAKQLRLRCTLLDGNGAEVASAVVQPYRWERGKTRNVLFPGGPLGWPYSNKSLGLLSAWRELEERGNRSTQRVMILLPVLPLPAGPGQPFREAVDLTVHFDVSRDRVRAVQRVTAEPALPSE
jgi:hypothetical protein